jgi:hypothetical protein
MNAFLKTILVLMLALATFNLGRYSAELSGSTAAWTAVVCGAVVAAVSLFVLIRDFWKSSA